MNLVLVQGSRREIREEYSIVERCKKILVRVIDERLFRKWSSLLSSYIFQASLELWRCLHVVFRKLEIVETSFGDRQICASHQIFEQSEIRDASCFVAI